MAQNWRFIRRKIFDRIMAENIPIIWKQNKQKLGFQFKLQKDKFIENDTYLGTSLSKLWKPKTKRNSWKPSNKDIWHTERQ